MQHLVNEVKAKRAAKLAAGTPARTPSRVAPTIVEAAPGGRSLREEGQAEAVGGEACAGGAEGAVGSASGKGKGWWRPWK